MTKADLINNEEARKQFVSTFSSSFELHHALGIRHLDFVIFFNGAA